MPIERWVGMRVGMAVALGLFLGPPMPLAGQGEPGPIVVGTAARVSSVRFDFVSGSAIPVSVLRQRIAFDGPGSLVGLRSALDFFPGVAVPELEPFSPLTLQQDVVRLRRVYRRAGFPNASVDYRVAYEPDAELVEITFVIDQGPELVLASVDVEVVDALPGEADGPGPGATRLPPELEEAWRAQVAALRRSAGERMGEQERASLVNRTADWFLDHGYPWPAVAIAGADTIDHRVDLRLRARPGPRARVDSVAISGQQRLADPVLRREIPLRPGDWYSGRRVTSGERGLYELALVRRALGDAVAGQPHDETVTLQYRVEEARPRVIRGRVGWRSESGVAGEAHWSHRNFFGGARDLTTSIAVESGWGALEDTRGRGIGVSALLRQPYVGHRSLSGTIGPYAEYRDDLGGRFLELGLETALSLRTDPLRAVTLQHALSRTRVDESPDLLPIRTLVEEGDSAFAPVFVQSVIGVHATVGTLDDRLDPRAGFLVEPALEVTGPFGVSDVDYVRASLQAIAALPLSARTGLFVRASGGRLFPSGESDPEVGMPRTRALVGLRSAMFTAGGTADVRGWGRGLVGSKIPDVTVDAEGAVSADRYVPVGGLVRLTGSLELGLPFPGLGERHRTYAFLDAGRVWSPEPGFEPGDPDLRGDGWAFGTGGGVQLGTLIGPIRIAVGYKLNPTLLDLIDPGAVAGALAAGSSLDGLPRDRIRRWHLHLSIGRSL